MKNRESRGDRLRTLFVAFNLIYMVEIKFCYALPIQTEAKIGLIIFGLHSVN